MKQEDWTSKLRDRLADYETPADDGLWDEIAKSLPVQETARRKPLTVWLRRWAVAAAVAALVLTGGLLWKNGTEHPRDIAGNGTVMPRYGKETSTETKDRKSKMPVILAAESGRKNRVTDNIRERSMPDPPITTETKTETAAEAHIQESAEENRPERQEPDMRHNVSKGMQDGTRQLMAQATKDKHAGGRFTASLYASNVMNDRMSSSNGVLMSANRVNVYSMNDNNGSFSAAKQAPMYLNNYKEEVEHHQPVSIGLSVSYSLTERLWMESGVVYTKLSSDFTRKMSSSTMVENQTMHYVGVPLRAGYDIWSYKGLNVYAVAGGQADFNVDAKVEKEGIAHDTDKDRVQFSVNVSAGVQYDFLPGLGVYVEPGAKYYIDNGSDINNIFKDKKLNFSLQFGLRYGINK